MKRIAIFAALRWECQPPLRPLRGVSKRRVDQFTVWQGRAGDREVWLVKTGMGVQRTERAARALVRCSRFDALVSTGCAGALAPTLQPGDLVIATTVVDRATGRRYDTDAAVRSSWQTVAARVAVHAVLEPELCSAEVLTSVADKRAAASASGAAAVDMESAAIGACAADAGIGFGLVRAILDTAKDDVEASFAFVDAATGGVKPLALAAHLARHPGALSQLLSLQRQMSCAQASLSKFFTAWLSA